MTAVNADFLPILTHSGGETDHDPLQPPFSSFKVSSYTELAGALELPVNSPDDNVQPSAQSQALTAWFTVPVPYLPNHEIAGLVTPTTPVQATANFEVSGSPEALLSGAPLGTPSNTPSWNPSMYAPDLDCQIVAPFPTHAAPNPLDHLLRHLHSGCYDSMDEQEDEMMSFEYAGQWTYDPKANVDNAPSESQPFSHSRARTPEGAFEVHQPPSRSQSGSVDGLPASETLRSPSTDGCTPHDRPPPEDIPPSSDEDVHPDADEDVHPDADEDVHPDVDEDIHPDADTPPGSNDDTPHNAPHTVGMILLGNADAYVQNNRNGTCSCTWIKESGERCVYSSTWVLVKRHVKRRHYKERTYPCAYCADTFFSSFNRDVHHNTHTREKPFVCISCGKGFGSPSGCSHHRISVHGIRMRVRRVRSRE